SASEPAAVSSEPSALISFFATGAGSSSSFARIRSGTSSVKPGPRTPRASAASTRVRSRSGPRRFLATTESYAPVGDQPPVDPTAADRPPPRVRSQLTRAPHRGPSPRRDRVRHDDDNTPTHPRHPPRRPGHRSPGRRDRGPGAQRGGRTGSEHPAPPVVPP